MDSTAFAFDNSYARLPQNFFARREPTPVSKPRLLRLNRPLAGGLGLSAEYLSTPQGIDVLAGNRVPEGAQPLAMAYAGFQFGNWVPQLGDGRAILLGELVDPQGVRRDVQLKGAGPTPFSRGGDGRAGVGPVLREYVVSEAMAALGIPTTRALAAVATGDMILREAPLPGAVLTRVATSHVRVGTFQYFAGQRDIPSIRALADYIIARHHPSLVDAANPYMALLTATLDRQAELIAQWQCVGFIHGVMNTDNMSIVGETIDYGPCAFMDGYHPGTVFSSIDRNGRYAYGNQPAIAGWNLTGLAQAMLPILGDDPKRAVDEANGLLQSFLERFEARWLRGMRRKLGLGEERQGDAELAGDLLGVMAEQGADFTLTFRRLGDAIESTPAGDDSVSALFAEPGAFERWAQRWRSRMAEERHDPSERRDAMRAINPAYIPRNHLVEEVIRAAIDEDDLAPFEQLTELLETPFVQQPGRTRYAAAPRPEQVVHATFCGT